MASVKSSSAAKAASAGHRGDRGPCLVGRKPQHPAAPGLLGGLPQRGDLRDVQRGLLAPDQLDPDLAGDCSLSPAGVSQAMTWPRSITATRSRTVSASMTLWVTSSTVAPRSARRRSTADHTARRATGSIPVVGSSSTRTRAVSDQRGGEAGQPALPAGELLQRPPGDLGEPELLEDRVPLPACSRREGRAAAPSSRRPARRSARRARSTPAPGTRSAVRPAPDAVPGRDPGLLRCPDRAASAR